MSISSAHSARLYWVFAVLGIVTLACGGVAGATTPTKTMSARQAAGLEQQAAEGGDARDAVAPTPDASESAKRVRREFVDLADAWAAGGGRYGYPYWEKAWHRWRSREIGASTFREYVTGYRDALLPGCDLIEELTLEDDAVRDIRGGLVEACRERIAALRSQQERLELLIESGRAADQEKLAELAAAFDDRLQSSYRRTRMAMNDAQAQLDALGLERIPEDSFI